MHDLAKVVEGLDLELIFQEVPEMIKQYATLADLPKDLIVLMYLGLMTFEDCALEHAARNFWGDQYQPFSSSAETLRKTIVAGRKLNQILKENVHE